VVFLCGYTNTFIFILCDFSYLSRKRDKRQNRIHKEFAARMIRDKPMNVIHYGENKSRTGGFAMIEFKSFLMSFGGMVTIKRCS